MPAYDILRCLVGTEMFIRDSYGVVVRDGRPWLTATGELPPQSVKGDTHGGADTAVVVGQDA